MNILTYPARPIKSGPLPDALKAGAYPGSGYSLEPKFNGWRAMVHTPTGTMYNRHGEPLSIRGEFDCALDHMKVLPFEWLDCEALERRHGIGKGTLVVLDWIVREPLSYRQRRLFLANEISEIAVGMEVFLNNHEVRLTPSHPLDAASRMWEALPRANQQLHCIFYEGVVTKRDDSEYPIQLRSDSEESPDWVKHRFTTK